jgi:hypothetical protein
MEKLLLNVQNRSTTVLAHPAVRTHHRFAFLQSSAPNVPKNAQNGHGTPRKPAVSGEDACGCEKGGVEGGY